MIDHFRVMLAGPGTLRFFLQPALAILLGVMHGLRDARLGHPPFLRALLELPSERRSRLAQGLTAIALPLLIAFSASLIFQWVVRAHVRALVAALYAVLFVALPYAAARSLTNRAARRRHRPLTA
jgi:hypothetical protein